MKKYFLLFLIMISIIFLSTNLFSYSLEGTMHKNDFYAVSFDGEGDAIVRSKFIIENYSKKPIKELRFQFPQNAIIYYVAQVPYANYYYESGDYHSRTYKRLDFNMERYADYLNVRIFFPEELKPQSSISIFVLYKIPELAKKDLLGNFNFEFKTAIDIDAVLTNRVRVAVNTQPGFMLKGVKSGVNYKQDFFSESIALQMVKELPLSYYDTYDTYYNIEYTQGLVKEAYSLDQYESFSVRGSYSENGIVLYLPEILIGILVLAIILGLAFFAIKRFSKRSLQSKARSKGEEQQQSIKEVIGEAYKSTFIAIVLTSLAVAVLVIITVYAFIAFGDFLRRIEPADYHYSMWLAVIYCLLLVLTVISEFILPAYFVYKRYSLIAGIATFLLSLVLLFIIVFIIGLMTKPTIYYNL
ncbi:MAG: hypothetical protein QXM75_00765 [Candidatus Diapherotrites archaeon]